MKLPRLKPRLFCANEKSVAHIEIFTGFCLRQVMGKCEEQMFRLYFTLKKTVELIEQLKCFFIVPLFSCQLSIFLPSFLDLLSLCIILINLNEDS